MPELPSGTLTLLFSDLEESTGLLRELGAARYAELLDAHCRLVTHAVSSNRGYDVDTQGDSFFSVFRTARDAVTAAADIQRTHREHAFPGDSTVRVRIGLHTGEPVVAGDRYVGLTVHRAARIMGAARGGQILISGPTADLLADELPSGIGVRELGEYRLKGVERPERLYEVTVAGLDGDPLPRLSGARPISPKESGPAVDAAGAARGLLEREANIEWLASALRRAQAREGRIVLVEGEAGIGKSALLEVARDLALAAGWTVLTARGGQLERDFAHGVTRQLYEPLLHATPPRQREAWLNGAAELAAPVLGHTSTAGAGSGPGRDPGFAANHGLYWLTANIAESGPLLLLVDDAHWVDSATLLFVNYLGRRLDGLAVLVALGLRPEPGESRRLVESLLELPCVESLSPSPLSEDATEALIERLLGRPAEAAFRDACYEVTGGNPFLLGELLRALAAAGIAPDDDSAGRVRRLAPHSIARSVLGRLGAMGHGAMALAEAVSVLETDAELRHAAALAELDQRAAESAADALTAALVLDPGRPLRFAHPVMRRAVYEELPAARRAGAHLRAARLLDSAGGDPDRAAVHLLATEPAGDAWTVDRLRAAARRALSRGAPDATATLLRRALAEPPAQEEGAAVLLELGRAERLGGVATASEQLRQALAQATDGHLRAEAAQELAMCLAMSERVEEAVELLERAIERAPDRETALLLEARLFGLSQASDALAAQVAERLESMCDGIRGETPGERLALAASVFHRAFLVLGSGEEVAELARRALGDGRLLSEATGDDFAFYGPLMVLRDADYHDEVRPLLEQAIADARVRGSAGAASGTLSIFARLEQIQGNLLRAEAAARSAVELAASSIRYRLSLPLALAALVAPLVDRGDLAGAEEALASHGLLDGPPPPTTTGSPFLAARAKLHLAQNRVDMAVGDTKLMLERQRRRGGLPAAAVSSILHPALPFLAASDRETARALAEELVTVAERWGVAGYTGICLRTLGLAVGGEGGTEHLGRAVELLEQSPRRLELGHALVELGAALRRGNRRSEAREPLRRGMELAHRCGALPLVERAQAELRATGARPRKLVFTGVDSLTAQERRVAELAAEGHSNPEIAQSLFVTRRTVETHLRHAYQKLDISGREELRQALETAAA